MLSLMMCNGLFFPNSKKGVLLAGEMLGISLTVSAGALVNVDASHLPPEVEKKNKRYSMISLAVGVLVAAFIVMSKR